MPSDSNGVYSLPVGYLAVTGETIQASQHNPPLEDLAQAMTQRLMRSGAAPMTGPLKAVDGSSGSPAIQFNNASSTGIYKTANGLGISVNGSLVAEFRSGGMTTGGHRVGDLILHTRTDASPLCVLPYGQNLNRADYPDLWALAQSEIAKGNTFYNNGNGTTTFGIGDLRGRVPAAWDSMGGTSANRLTGLSGGVDGDVIGATGGAETHTLVTAQMPSHNHTFSGNPLPSHTHGVTVNSGGDLIDNRPGSSYGGGGVGSPTSIGIQSASAGTPTGSISNTGSGQEHNNVQPTFVCNFELFAGA